MPSLSTSPSVANTLRETKADLRETRPERTVEIAQWDRLEEAVTAVKERGMIPVIRVDTREKLQEVLDFKKRYGDLSQGVAMKVSREIKAEMKSRQQDLVFRREEGIRRRLEETLGEEWGKKSLGVLRKEEAWVLEGERVPDVVRVMREKDPPDFYMSEEGAWEQTKAGYKRVDEPLEADEQDWQELGSDGASGDSDVDVFLGDRQGEEKEGDSSTEIIFKDAQEVEEMKRGLKEAPDGPWAQPVSRSPDDSHAQGNGSEEDASANGVPQQEERTGWRSRMRKLVGGVRNLFGRRTDV